MKLLAPHINITLSDLINESLKSGIYPTCLKNACIKPLHKKDSKLLVENYRPISLLSNINKIFEKVIHHRVYDFLEKKQALYENQFGFRKGHNTNHALIALTESIRRALDQNNFAVGVFIDLQKAFDTVEHNILLKRLNHYGIRGIANNLFKSYLTERKQFVEIDGQKSSQINIMHGVPQGSVLGPLLFLIYINDLHQCIQHSSTFHFADDTSLLCKGPSLKKLNKQINQDLKGLCVWLQANKISLNTKKTEIILFRNIYKIYNKKMNFRLSGQKLSLSTEVKYLGVILDQHLTWKPHLNNIITKLSKATGILSKLRHYVNMATLLSICYSLFQSHLIYSMQAWGHITAEYMTKITNLQKRALRIIHFLGPRESASPLFLKSRILPIDKHIKMNNCIFALKYKKGFLPKYFNNFFNPVGATHQHNTKSSNLKLEIVRTRTVNFGTHCVKNLTAKHWNEIIPNIDKNLINLSTSTAKHHIKSFLLSL